MTAKKPTKKVRITQVKSVISAPPDQRATVRALGLKRIRHSVEQEDCATIRGMVFKVKHLVDVEDV